MEALKYAFNVTRNISLIIVVCLIVWIVYLVKNPQIIENYCTPFEKERESLVDGMDNMEGDTTNQVEIDRQIVEIDDEMPPHQEEKKATKLKIKTSDGLTYLNPSKFLYAQTNNGGMNVENGIQLFTVDKDTLTMNLKLSELEEALSVEEGQCFFRIKSAIINCDHVLQLIQESKKIGEKYNYQYVAIMEGGGRINISKEKYNDFEEILGGL